MAATLADLTRLDKILKDRELQNSIITAMNKATPFAEKITQSMPFSGRKLIVPVQFGVNEGIFALPEKGTFGDSQVDMPVLAEITPKYVYALFEITGQIISHSRDSAGAFEEGLGLTLQNTLDGFKLDLARQYLGDGAAVLGLSNGTENVTTGVYQFDSPFGLSIYKSARPVRHFVRKNMAVSILDAATPTTVHESNLPVAAVSHASTYTSLTLTGGTTDVADGDLLIRAGNRVGATSYEIEGFLKAVDDGTTHSSYLGITRTGEPNWQGILVDAAQGAATTVALDPDHLRDTADLVMETTGESPGFMMMNYKQRRNFYNLTAPQIRFGPMMLPQGLNENTLSFDDMAVLVERFFPPEMIALVNTNYWYHIIDKEPEWISGIDGTVLHFNQTKDQFKAVLRSYRNLACLYPATQALIYGLEE